ncbi:MAG: hypothetical protein JO149_06335 [Gammaproteobacteria bacterium]|nr:hypothetical protein [Gammaproteobacteria bacterium]
MFSSFFPKKEPMPIMMAREQFETALMKILNDQIEAYLKNDLSWKIGDEGERRAKTYFNYLNSAKKGEGKSDDDILHRVMQDIKSVDENGSLGTSTDLRNRLLAGVCQYLDINELKIDRIAARSIPNTVHSPVSTLNSARKYAAFALISEKLNDRPMDVRRDYSSPRKPM